MSYYIIWLLVAILYTPIFRSLYTSRWGTVDYTHAYFILPISLWLTWRKRHYLKELFQKTKPNNTLFGFPLFIFGISMFIFGWREDYLFISTLSLVPVLYGLIIYLYGMNIAKVLSFPIFYLLLLVPPPLGILDTVTLPMRYGISILTATILKFLHYPIIREGLLLFVGGKEIFMGQPCSGFRSLITLFSLALVYVYTIQTKLIKKLIFISLTIPFVLIGNLIRIIILCLVTYYFGEKAAQGFFHNFSGIIIFLIMIFGLLGLERLLDKFSQNNKTDEKI